MKGFTLVCFLAVVALTMARPDEHYTDRYDNIDLDEILGNKRLLESYVNCMLELGKCTTEGKELKSHMKEAMETDCGKCTEAQRQGTKKVIRHLINHEPEYWNQLKAKFDPTNLYSKKYETELKELKA